MSRLRFVPMALCLALIALPGAHALTKGDLTDVLVKRGGVGVPKATEIINIIFSAAPREGIIASDLAAGREVTIPGFGTFGTRPGKAGLKVAFTPHPALARKTKEATPVAAKSSLTARLAKGAGLSEVRAGALVNAIFDANPGKGIFAKALAAGATVDIPGFGTFGGHPVTFKPAKALLKRLND